EATEDAAYPDVLTHTGYAGPQRADAAGEDVDLGAGLRRFVELGDDVLVGEVVDLDAGSRALALLRGLRGLADLLDQPLTQVERRDQELPEPRRPAEAGEEVEEIGDVGRDLRVGREEAEVLVRSGCRGVVVPGADVGVAPELVALPPDDQRRLRMNLPVRKAVHHMHAGLLEGARPLDVPPLV